MVCVGVGVPGTDGKPVHVCRSWSVNIRYGGPVYTMKL